MKLRWIVFFSGLMCTMYDHRFCFEFHGMLSSAFSSMYFFNEQGSVPKVWYMYRHVVLCALYDVALAGT